MLRSGILIVSNMSKMKIIKQKDVNPSPTFHGGEEAELLKFKTCYIAHKTECSERLVCNAN